MLRMQNQNTFLFVICPPLSGSTVLWKLLATSPQVSAFETEGQHLPDVRDVMRRDPWNPNATMPWEQIKKAWMRQWDLNKPILLEKSPPHILRTDAIARHFQPVRFIIMVRNPFAQCEGLMRRHNWSVERSAQFVANCLQVQMQNARTLPDATYLTYESFADDVSATAQRILEFMPELESLDHARTFKANSLDGLVSRPITNLNERKINNLKASDVNRIADVLTSVEEAVAYWGYADSFSGATRSTLSIS